MSQLKIVKMNYYDKFGKKCSEEDFVYLTINIGQEENPAPGDFFVQLSKIEGAPVIVSQYADNEFGGNFGRPWDFYKTEEITEKFKEMEVYIPEIKEIAKSKGIEIC